MLGVAAISISGQIQTGRNTLLFRSVYLCEQPNKRSNYHVCVVLIFISEVLHLSRIG